MARDKEEFPPLFPGGFVEIQDQSEFEALFVQGFTHPGKRAYLVERLRGLLKWLAEAVPVEWEVWLDGSFCTQKMEPDDVDLVCFFHSDQIDALPPKEANMAEILGRGFAMQMTLKQRYDCDCYFIARENAADRNTWLEWFGFQSDGVTPKGIARLWLNRSP